MWKTAGGRDIPVNTRIGAARDGCNWGHERLSDAQEMARTIKAEQMVE